MAIDTIIDYSCMPKEIFGIEGILSRLKAGERADAVIRLYQEREPNRPPDQIAFEVTRRSANGAQETEMVFASSLLAQRAQLDTVRQACEGCPANRTGRPFGCFGAINYPISMRAEAWLLQQLPFNDEPLLYLMLKKGIEEFGYTGESARALRNQAGVYFESAETLARRYHEMQVTSDQIFEMTFLLGPIQPGHAAMLLLFYNAIPRHNMDVAEIMRLTRPTPNRAPDFEVPPLSLDIGGNDDPSLRDIEGFLRALHLAYRLNVSLLLDV